MKRFQNMCVAVMVLLAIAAVGCGSPTISGTVSFSDGSTLGEGAITFTHELSQFTGEIGSDGTYAVKPSGELAAGTYKVSLGGNIFPAEDAATHRSAGEGDAAYDGDEGGGGEVGSGNALVASKFSSPETSGLTAKITGGSGSFDFTVEKP